jgi:synaptonemal complex protein 2
MDDFTTKTLKLTQQHLMAMTSQAQGRRSVAQICLVDLSYCALMSYESCCLKTINLCLLNRDENVEKFQVTLLDELEKVEKDSQTLRDLEKELVVCVSKN